MVQREPENHHIGCDLFLVVRRCLGYERRPDQMRSDYAKPETLTEVTFDFSLGNEVYRVKRIPKQEIPKRKGVGTEN